MTPEQARAMHVGFTQVVYDVSAVHHVNPLSGTGYMILGPIEVTVFHPEDAYKISEAFLQMGRDMEEWRSQHPAEGQA